MNALCSGLHLSNALRLQVAKTLVHLGNAHGNLEEFTKQKQYFERVLMIREWLYADDADDDVNDGVDDGVCYGYYLLDSGEANYGTEHALTAAALAGLAVPLHGDV
jgi:hypothetical protein